MLPIIYLNRTYAYFYDYQGDHFIANPSYPSPFLIKKSSSAKIKKLVVLGDSLTAGIGSTKYENSLGFLIAQNLSKDSSLELLNFAKPGVGIKDVLNRQLPQTIEKKPDYVVLMIGINDIHNKTSDSYFKLSYKEILEKLKTGTSARVILINIPDIGSDRILFPPWDTVFDFQIKKFNNIVSEVALEKDFTVIDLYSQFRNEFKQSSDLYSADQFHPSDKGYKLWGEYINANFNR